MPLQYTSTTFIPLNSCMTESERLKEGRGLCFMGLVLLGFFNISLYLKKHCSPFNYFLTKVTAYILYIWQTFWAKNSTILPPPLFFFSIFVITIELSVKTICTQTIAFTQGNLPLKQCSLQREKQICQPLELSVDTVVFQCSTTLSSKESHSIGGS